MRYQLPQAAKTSKLLNLPANLLALAEEALAEKFDLPEIVKEKPKPKPEKKATPQEKAPDLVDYHRIELELRCDGGYARRSMAVQLDVPPIIYFERELSHNIERLYQQMRGERGQYYMGPGGVDVRIYTAGATWVMREGEDPRRVIYEIWRALKSERIKAPNYDW